MANLSKDRGWAWPLLAKKPHYFVGGRSLCGKWMFLGDCEKDRGIDTPEDCKSCQRKLRASNPPNPIKNGERHGHQDC